MTVRELKILLDLCDDDLDIRIDADSLSWYEDGDDPDLSSAQYVEGGCTEVHFPNKVDQNIDDGYLLLKN